MGVVRTGDAIVGARGPPVEVIEPWLARLHEAAAARGLTAQALDANAVCGRVHAESALLHARRALDRGTNFARSLEVEWALCVAGVRQVGTALKRVGLSNGTDCFAILLVREDDEVVGGEVVLELLDEVGLSRDDDVLDCDEDALRRLGVGEAEKGAAPRERWPLLALERTAMLDLER